MSAEQVAKSIGKTRGPHSITFEVSEAVLEEWRNDPDHWSEPVRFRFERNPWGWDLVMQTQDAAQAAATKERSED